MELLAALAEGTPLDDVSGIAFKRDGEVVATTQRPHIVDLDTLRPRGDLLDWEDYHYNIDPWGRMASILTSRGCMMGCSFCSQRVFWRGEWRARDPDKVAGRDPPPRRGVQGRVHHDDRRVPHAATASAGRRSSTCSSRPTSASTC